MTDLESLKNMLDRAEIEWKEEKVEDQNAEQCTELYVEQGYAGFYTCFEFDKYGKLDDVGAYE